MIVLLTDFGPSEYVGVMKGVIKSIDQSIDIVDLCHTIKPQSIIEGSWVLKNNYTFFPKGTIFCCVIDPGVGSNRKAIHIKTEKYNFVGPDNGLFYETIKEQKIKSIKTLKIPDNASDTFHGRDVFAKASAYIDSNTTNKIYEKQIKKIFKLDIPSTNNSGIIVRIDHYGNIITNIPAKNPQPTYDIQINKNHYQMNFHKTYNEGNNTFLIKGSSKTFEISKKNGNALKELDVSIGDKITIKK